MNGPAFLLLPEDHWPEDIPKTKLPPDFACDVPTETVLLADGT